MTHRSNTIVVFRVYNTSIEASLAKMKLLAHDIPCFISEENMTNLFPYSNGVFTGARLHLFAKDYERASLLLEQIAT